MQPNLVAIPYRIEKLPRMIPRQEQGASGTRSPRLFWYRFHIHCRMKRRKTAALVELTLGRSESRLGAEARSQREDWQELYLGTVIGYKRICVFAPVTARRIRITITESRRRPALSHFAVHLGANGRSREQ